MKRNSQTPAGAPNEAAAPWAESVFVSNIDAMILVDAKGLTREANVAALKLFQYNIEGVVGESWAEMFLHTEVRSVTQSRICAALRSVETGIGSFRIETVATGAMGMEFQAELSVSRLATPGFEGWFCLQVRDISEVKARQSDFERNLRDVEDRAEAHETRFFQTRKRLAESETRLQESEELFRKVFQSSPVFVAIVRLADEAFVEVNEKFTEWSGWTRQDALGRTTMDLKLWVEDVDRTNFLCDLRDQGSIRHRECLMRTRSGQLDILLISAEKVSWHDQPHAISAGLIITSLKRAETELRAALEKEQDLQRIKSEFVNLVSHEFRTPLGVILSSCEILEHYFERLTGPQRKEHLRDIANATRDMTRLMDEVLFLGKADSGRLKLNATELDLVEFSRTLANELAGATGHRCPVILKKGRGSLRVPADPTLLRHILANLVSNAIKYSPDGSPVELRLNRRAQEVVFEVQDQGIGIPAAEIARLFEPFCRASNVGERPGSGLGLVIVKRCVAMHGGTLSLESEIGRGTLARVSLPLTSIHGISKTS